MRPAPTRMFEWCLCDTAAATASWASVDLDGFLERTKSGDWFRRDSSRAGGKRQPARCSRKTQNKFAIVSMTEKFLHCYRCMCIFCGEYACIHTGVLEHHACAGFYVKQVLWHQRTHLRTCSMQDVRMCSCMCSLFIQHWGTRTGGFS